jgi:hypothetical protein
MSGESYNEDKNYFELAPRRSLDDVPEIKQGFYLLLIEHGWATSISQSLEANLNAFKARLGEHTLVQLSDEQQTQAAREKFKSNRKYEPTLVITSKHPAIWDPKRDADEGLKIGLGALESPDEVPLYLDYIASILNTDDFLRAARWDARRRYLIRYLKKVPVVDILALFVGAA